MQWWWQLRPMKCVYCHPNSSKAWYRAHTTFDDPMDIYRHHSGITLQQHSCEFTPRPPTWFLHFPKCNDGGSWGGWNVSTVIPALQRLGIGSIQHLMTLWVYTDTILASHYSNIHVSIPPEQYYSCTSQSAMMVAVEVDEMYPLSSQLFKGLV